MGGMPVKRLTEIGGSRVPFLRWCFVRMVVGTPKLLKEWQVGDGREEALAQYVLANARRVANAAITRRIWDHAGAGARLAVVVGTLGDGGATVERLESEHNFAKGSVDLIFIDHDKNAYVPDLELIIERGWLHRGL